MLVGGEGGKASSHLSSLEVHKAPLQLGNLVAQGVYLSQGNLGADEHPRAHGSRSHRGPEVMGLAEGR